MRTVKTSRIRTAYVAYGRNFYRSRFSLVMLGSIIHIACRISYTLKSGREKSSLSITRSFISQLLSDTIFCTANGAEVIRASTFNLHSMQGMLPRCYRFRLWFHILLDNFRYHSKSLRSRFDRGSTQPFAPPSMPD